jgi:hypothetical protein
LWIWANDFVTALLSTSLAVLTTEYAVGFLISLSGPNSDIPFNHDVELHAIVRCMLSAAVVIPEAQSNMSCAEPRISAVEIAKIQSSE